jgi:hypothetical protein
MWGEIARFAMKIVNSKIVNNMAHLKSILPLNEVVTLYARQSAIQIQTNMRTQHIWPTELYPGYSAINEKRKKLGQWHSTGRGVNSFHFFVQATEPDNATVMFTFLDYLRYVDLGVGQGTKAEDVNRARNAHFKRRYATQWNRGRGQSHRPSIMMEMRHLASRIQKHLVNYYSYKGEMWVGAIAKDEDGKVKVKIRD